jgi:hypothetical protein
MGAMLPVVGRADAAARHSKEIVGRRGGFSEERIDVLRAIQIE